MRLAPSVQLGIWKGTAFGKAWGTVELDGIPHSPNIMYCFHMLYPAIFALGCSEQDGHFATRTEYE